MGAIIKIDLTDEDLKISVDIENATKDEIFIAEKMVGDFTIKSQCEDVEVTHHYPDEEK